MHLGLVETEESITALFTDESGAELFVRITNVGERIFSQEICSSGFSDQITIRPFACDALQRVVNIVQIGFPSKIVEELKENRIRGQFKEFNTSTNKRDL